MAIRLLLMLVLSLTLTVGAAKSQDNRGTFRTYHSLEFGGLESVDPLSQYRFSDILARAYEGLVHLDRDGMIAPRLATEWSPNDDATIWTFIVREGVPFHNGHILTARDVAYSFNRVLDPAVDTPVRAVLGIMKQVTAPDDRTVVFELNAPHADFPLLLADYRALVI
jgi:peptide/nickel transport system substrate-binding protein